jgi:AcrR family transcriptional regulator
VLLTTARGPGRPPAAASLETRERILGAAREVFGEAGYDAATFEAIASRAELTRPAISHYFASKHVLYGELVAKTNEMVIVACMAKAETQVSLFDRLSAFFSAAMHVDTRDRSGAAFMANSILESQRHPVLSGADNNLLETSRAFVTWAVTDAIERGELSTDADASSLVELLVAVMCGMSLYAGYVGGRDELGTLTGTLELLLANKLWRLQ